MTYAYLISSFVTGIITFSWYTSHYGRPQFPEPTNANRTSGRYASAAGKHHVPGYMWDIYRNGVAGGGGGGNASGPDVVKGIKPRYLGSPFWYPNHGKQEIEFAVPEAGTGERLTTAEVRVSTKALRRLDVTFWIYGADGSLLDRKSSSSSSGADWISLDVTRGPELAAGTRARFVVVSTFGHVAAYGYKLGKRGDPVLLLSYRSEASRGRRKRDAAEEYEEVTNRIWRGRAARNACRRRPLYVDFADIEYDAWIVAPTGYEAFQCTGKCTFPVGEHLSPTKHAIVQTLLHHVAPGKVGRACCVPTRLDPISILYVDSEGVLTYRFRFEDMVVAECGCR